MIGKRGIQVKTKSYHHGNLRNELIEAGLKIINEVGVENLSLRKAASMCGVSHAAPKSHFEDKEAFIAAIKEQVTEVFTEAMQSAVEETKDPRWLIYEFGKAYVQYFAEHPDRFVFLTNQRDIEVRISANQIYESSYLPFQIFQEHASAILMESGVVEQLIPKKIIALWAMVNGLAGLTAMKGFCYEGDWMEMVESILAGSDKLC